MSSLSARSSFVSGCALAAALFGIACWSFPEIGIAEEATTKPDAPPTANEPPAGFVALFNGKDLTGWCGRGHVHPLKFNQLSESEKATRQQAADADLKKHWRVENGELINDGHGVFCTTVQEYGDFELLVDWKMVAPRADSGIYLRGSPQVQIWDPADPGGRKHNAHLGSGGLWNNNPGSPGKDPLVKADRPIGEWNTFRIRLVGDRATVHFNDQLVVDNVVMHNFWDRDAPLYDRGPIQLQTHGGEMRFRNIFLHKIEKQDPGKSPSGDQQAYTQTIPGSEVTFDMVPIPGGEFQIGSPASEAGRKEDEGPQVTVRVEPFWMGKHEITWAEYKEFMKLVNVFEEFDDQGIRQITEENQVDAVTAPSSLYEPSFTFETGDDPDQPAVSMSQYAAKQYTKWLSLLTGTFYRLPTEAEWEYACRAGATTAYSYGDDPAQLTQYAWYYEQAEEDYITSKVGQHKPNKWGLHDMHGNVAEWVLDQYDAGHYAKHAGRTVTAEEFINWPTKLFPRVLRGGSWFTEEPEDCRSAARLPTHDDDWRGNDPNTPMSPWWFASDEGQAVGFRLVRPAKTPPREEWAKYWEADLEQIQEHVDRRIDKEGRGNRGLVDPKLPAAIQQLNKKG